MKRIMLLLLLLSGTMVSAFPQLDPNAVVNKDDKDSLKHQVELFADHEANLVRLWDGIYYGLAFLGVGASAAASVAGFKGWKNSAGILSIVAGALVSVGAVVLPNAKLNFETAIAGEAERLRAELYVGTMTQAQFEKARMEYFALLDKKWERFPQAPPPNVPLKEPDPKKGQ